MNIEESVDTEFYKGHSIEKHKPRTNTVMLTTNEIDITEYIKSQGYSLNDVVKIEVFAGYYNPKTQISVKMSENEAIDLAKKKIDDKIKREAKKILKLKEKLELTQKQLEETLENTAKYERFLNITPKEE